MALPFQFIAFNRRIFIARILAERLSPGFFQPFSRRMDHEVQRAVSHAFVVVKSQQQRNSNRKFFGQFERRKFFFVAKLSGNGKRERIDDSQSLSASSVGRTFLFRLQFFFFRFSIRRFRSLRLSSAPSWTEFGFWEYYGPRKSVIKKKCLQTLQTISTFKNECLWSFVYGEL